MVSRISEPSTNGRSIFLISKSHWHSIELGHLSHMQCTCHGASNACCIIRVVSCLAGQEPRGSKIPSFIGTGVVSGEYKVGPGSHDRYKWGEQMNKLLEVG